MREHGDQSWHWTEVGRLYGEILHRIPHDQWPIDKTEQRHLCQGVLNKCIVAQQVFNRVVRNTEERW